MAERELDITRELNNISVKYEDFTCNGLIVTCNICNKTINYTQTELSNAFNSHFRTKNHMKRKERNYGIEMII